MPGEMEPVSPELALIDPALARAHLPFRDEGVRLPRSRCLTPLPARRAAPWSTVTKLVAALALAACGFLVAHVVAYDRPASAAPSFAVAPTKSHWSIEQRLLSLVAVSERRRLPTMLLDPATGLPKDNLQAVCHNGRSGSQVCVVRPAEHRPSEGLYVRYTPGADGNGRFTWYAYRMG